MSAASWQLSATPYHGSLGRTSGAAYGSYFKPSGNASVDTGSYVSRTLTSIPTKVFTGYEPSGRTEKYSSVTASDIQKIVDAALSSKGADKAYVPVVSDLGSTAQREEPGPLFTYNQNRNFQHGYTGIRQPGYAKLDSSTTLTSTRPYSSNITLGGTQKNELNDGIPKFERSSTTLGLSGNASTGNPESKDTFNSRRPLTPYNGYDNMSGASQAATTGNEIPAKQTHAELPVGASATTTRYISERANYNTHQKYSEESKLLLNPSYRSTRSAGLKDSFLERTTSNDHDLENRKYIPGLESRGGYTAITPSYKLYSSIPKSLLDNNSSSSSENVAPVESYVSSNASRYRDSLSQGFNVPAPPRTPFPGRQDIVLTKNEFSGSRENLNKLSGINIEEVSPKSLTTSINNVHINSSMQVTSPRDRYMKSQLSVSTTSNGILGSDVYNATYKEPAAILSEPASAPLPISATSGKRSILKRVSSYTRAVDTYSTRTFSGVNPRDIPLLNGFRNEKLPPLSHMNMGDGSTKRVSSGKRVTFNFGHNTNHSYMPAVYENDEPYVSPYLWL